jgi:cation diffusion facilitator family transporter
MNISFDISRARNLHLDWEKTLQVLTTGNEEKESFPSHEACELGRWLSNVGLRKYWLNESTHKMVTEHRRFHEVGESILEQARQKNRSGVQQELKLLGLISRDIIFYLTEIELNFLEACSGASVQQQSLKTLFSKVFEESLDKDTQPTPILDVARARLTHLHWLQDLAKRVHSRDRTRGVTSSKDCFLGRWINEVGISNHPESKEILALNEKHERFHLLVEQTVTALAADHDNEADALYEEVVDCSKDLIYSISIIEHKLLDDGEMVPKINVFEEFQLEDREVGKSDEIAEYQDEHADYQDERNKNGDRAILVGAVINIILAGGKIMAGILGNSAALVADGVHSASDLVSDAVVWISGRIARQAPDKDHPYGHGRFETIAVLFIGILLIGVGVGIAIDAVGRIEHVTGEVPTFMALVAVVISILTKEGLFHYTKRVGEKYNLRALVANAWHHRSDAISSVAALAGIGGAMLGWPILDPIAAVLVAVILGKMGLEFLLDALREFTDSASAVDDAISKHIGEMVTRHPEVYSAHLLKARRAGPNIFVDVHAVVNPFLSVSEGHQIAEQMRRIIIRGVRDVTDVLVHIDPEEDQDMPMNIDYPDRHIVRENLLSLLADFPEFSDITELVLHYTRKGVVADLVLSVVPNIKEEKLQSSAVNLCNQILKSDEMINNVRLKKVLYQL